MSNSTKTYLVAKTSDSYYEVVTLIFHGATPGRLGLASLADLRTKVARLREMGFRPAKIRGGLDRAFRVLNGGV